MIGFMTRRDLRLDFGFVEEKSEGSGDCFVTRGFSRKIFPSLLAFTMIPGAGARRFLKVAWVI